MLVSLLIYFEQTALLYIFSTLGVTILLIIVAVTDLGKSDLSGLEAEPGNAQVTIGKSKK